MPDRIQRTEILFLYHMTTLNPGYRKIMMLLYHHTPHWEISTQTQLIERLPGIPRPGLLTQSFKIGRQLDRLTAIQGSICAMFHAPKMFWVNQAGYTQNHIHIFPTMPETTRSRLNKTEIFGLSSGYRNYCCCLLYGLGLLFFGPLSLISSLILPPVEYRQSSSRL